MSLLVVAVLSLLWLGFFLPSLLQARRTSSPYTSATSFQDSLRRLGEVPYPRPRDAGQQGRAPSRAAVARARRRETLAVLTAAVIGGALLAVGLGGWARWAVVPPLVAFTSYIVMLRREVVRRSAARTQRRRASRTAPEAVQTTAANPVDVPAEVGGQDADIVPSVARRGGLQSPERMAG